MLKIFNFISNKNINFDLKITLYNVKLAQLIFLLYIGSKN